MTIEHRRWELRPASENDMIAIFWVTFRYIAILDLFAICKICNAGLFPPGNEVKPKSFQQFRFQMFRCALSAVCFVSQLANTDDVTSLTISTNRLRTINCVQRV